MKNRAICFLIVLFVFGCTQIKNDEEHHGCEDQAEPIGDPELTDLEEIITYTSEINDNHYSISDILSSSAPELHFVKNKWISTALICSREEEFHKVWQYDDEGFIAISSLDSSNQKVYFLVDFSISGEVYTRVKIISSDYLDLDLTLIKNQKLFLSTRDQMEQIFEYSIKEKSIQEINSIELKDKVVEWVARIDDRYLSPDANKEIEMRHRTSLVLIQKGERKRLINQEYDGDWSFNSGTWSTNSEKFYFDNSGAVACIWEIDFGKMTLDKIVPEHDAHSPIYVDGDTDMVVYCQNECVHLAKKLE